MLWYGFRKSNSYKYVYKTKKRNNFLSKKYAYPVKTNIQLNKQNFRLHKPFNWDLIILKNNQSHQYTIHMLSRVYKITIPLPYKLNNLSYDPNSNILKINSLYVNVNYRLL